MSSGRQPFSTSTHCIVHYLNKSDFVGQTKKPKIIIIWYDNTKN